MSIQPYVDRLAEWATAGPFRDEVARARKDYFLHTGGEVFEDDKSVESRLTGFLEWYLCERLMDGRSVTPAAAYVEAHRAELSPDDLATFEAFTHTIPGLFEVRRLPKKERLRVREVCSGADHEVFERRQMAGVEKGDLLEARLVPHKGELLFSAAFTYHPREARKPILAELKRMRKLGPVDTRAFLQRLSAMALKYERYRNVQVQSIYAFDR